MEGKQFYNSLMQKCLDDNNFVMYFTYNGGMSVDVERFVKNLKSKIYKKLLVMIVNLILVVCKN